jgi:hypothetical protein
MVDSYHMDLSGMQLPMRCDRIDSDAITLCCSPDGFQSIADLDGVVILRGTNDGYELR